MQEQTASAGASGKISINNFLPDRDRIQEIRDVIGGLNAPQKNISSVYFYDELGSKLFEAITSLPEYYLTRTEKPLIEQASSYLAGRLGECEIVELGSGDCSKISILLRHLTTSDAISLRYIPVDISLSAVREAALTLIERFPGLCVDAIVTDFIAQLDLLPAPRGNRLFCFFGSTLGNLGPEQREEFFLSIKEAMNPWDRLLLGVDMIKDVPTTLRAYNDSQGITRKFNRNILNVVNEIAQTDFDDQKFEHVAFYNSDDHKIEMHLRAMEDLEISSPHHEHKIRLKKGETIHTEDSHKFSTSAIRQLGALADLKEERLFSDENGWFSLFLFTKNG